MEASIDQEKVRRLVRRAKKEKMGSDEFQEALSELLRESEAHEVGEASDSVAAERIRETAKKARRAVYR